MRITAILLDILVFYVERFAVIIHLLSLPVEWLWSSGRVCNCFLVVLGFAFYMLFCFRHPVFYNP